MESEARTIRWGGWAAMMVGAAYLIAAAAFFSLPKAQLPEATFDQHMASLAEDQTGFLILNWSLVIGAVAALAAVPAISSLVRAAAPELVGWGSALAYLGFGVALVDGLRQLTLVPIESQVHVNPETDERVRQMLFGDNLHLDLDPNGWLIFGGVGLWVLLVAVTALRTRAMPPLLGWIGVTAALFYWLTVAGNLSDTPALTAIAAALGGVLLAPGFYIWTGVLLVRKRRPSTPL